MVIVLHITSQAIASVNINCKTDARYENDVCFIDPSQAVLLNDTNTSGGNIRISNLEEFKDAERFDILSETNLTIIPIFIFNSFPKLTHLRLMTVGIKFVYKETFEEAHNLNHLELRGNALDVLTHSVFALAENLEYINLASNRISEINDGTFIGLDRLQYLYLSSNRLTILRRNTFEGAKNLLEVYLEDNQIETIEDEALHLPQLEIITLRSNKLKTLSDNLFLPNSRLEKIDVALNDLKRIGRTFFNCFNLYSLDLSQNSHISDLNFTALATMRSLSYLFLDHTGFEFPTTGQTNYSTIKSGILHLNLANNKLSNTDLLKQLSTFNELKILELEHNSLTHFDDVEKIGTWFPVLQYIGMDYNNLNCSWLMTIMPLMQSLNIEFKTDIICK